MPDNAHPDTPLISAPALAALLRAPSPAADVLVLDCRFSLADAQAGEAAYAAGHIPSAVYAHLDRDLSAPRVVAPSGERGRPGAFEGGRHPLPSPEAFQSTVRAWGVSPHTQVIAYDDASGMFAARAWWLLRWAGHARVQVLDGGWAAWVASQGDQQQDSSPARQVSALAVHGDPTQVVGTGEVLAQVMSQAAHAPESPRAPGHPIQAPTLPAESQSTPAGRRHDASAHGASRPVPFVLLDARAPDRFRGENETIDPVGGHIPGALNRFFQLNLGEGGRFKPAEQLRDEFSALLAGRPPEQVVHQCGSGVTACHNILAMEHAGLHGSRLYAGSWSAWVADADRPVAR